MPVYPGVATASEIEAALETGLTLMKAVADRDPGRHSVPRVAASPFGGVQFNPSGGVTAATSNIISRSRMSPPLEGAGWRPVIGSRRDSSIASRKRFVRLSPALSALARAGSTSNFARPFGGERDQALPRNCGSRTNALRIADQLRIGDLLRTAGLTAANCGLRTKYENLGRNHAENWRILMAVVGLILTGCGKSAPATADSATPGGPRLHHSTRTRRGRRYWGPIRRL